MKSELPQQPIQPKMVDPINVTLEDASRTVTFTQRAQLAIHPQLVVVPWAILKAVAAEILKYEATAEMAVHGAKVQTQTVVGAAKTTQ
jgi:phage major head subunit gpT-like protein